MTLGDEAPEAAPVATLNVAPAVPTLPLPEALLPGFAAVLQPLPKDPNAIGGPVPLAPPSKKPRKTYKLVDTSSVKVTINGSGQMEDSKREVVTSIVPNV